MKWVFVQTSHQIIEEFLTLATRLKCDACNFLICISRCWFIIIWSCRHKQRNLKKIYIFCISYSKSAIQMYQAPHWYCHLCQSLTLFTNETFSTISIIQLNSNLFVIMESLENLKWVQNSNFFAKKGHPSTPDGVSKTPSQRGDTV